MKKRRKKHILRMMLAFWATFIGVIILGTATILIYRGILGHEENKSLTASVEIEDETASALETEAETATETEPYLFAEQIPEEQISEEKVEEGLAETEETKEVTLAFAGDILFDPGYSVMARLLGRPNGLYDSFSQDLLDEMIGADIMMLNNEFPYSNGGAPTEGKQFTFRAKPESAELLVQMGVDIVSLANNHAYDYGEAALLDTFETLETVEIPYVGAGRNLEEAMAPVYFDMGGLTIGIVSATQIERLNNPDTKEATATSAGVFRCLNPDRLLEQIKEAKESSDFVVVYIHWGTENTAETDWAQLDQAPRIAEAGADLIIGDHPHCLQPIEYINGVPVVYSLGNFWFNSKPVDTGLVKAVVDKDGLQSLQFVPALQKDCITTMLHGEEKERVLSYMRSISPKITIDEEGYISQKTS